MDFGFADSLNASEIQTLEGAVPAWRPPRGLRSADVQCFLASSPTRKLAARWGRGREAFRGAEEWLLEVTAEDGSPATLQAFASLQGEDGPSAGPPVVILHGWEGSAGSAYVLSLTGRLFALGHDVVRLNLRDHGETHHLNEGLFHANRLRETVGAIREIGERLKERNPKFAEPALVGYSMGGNFAVRVALAAPEAGLPLDRVIAVNPGLAPSRFPEVVGGLHPTYMWYFLRKWRRSLRRKQACFPELYDFSHLIEDSSIVRMTEELVVGYTEYPNLEAYFLDYEVPPERLEALEVPTTLLTAKDDPIIPVEDFLSLPDVPALTLEITDHGGHCGFIEDFRLRSWADRRIAEVLQEG